MRKIGKIRLAVWLRYIPLTLNFIPPMRLHEGDPGYDEAIESLNAAVEPAAKPGEPIPDRHAEGITIDRYGRRCLNGSPVYQGDLEAGIGQEVAALRVEVANLKAELGV